MKTSYKYRIDHENFAEASLIRQSKREFILSGIDVPSHFRRQGWGSILLELICQDADRNDTVVHLMLGDGEDGMTPYDLEKWYGRFGFESPDNTWSHWFTRNPKQ